MIRKQAEDTQTINVENPMPDDLGVAEKAKAVAERVSAVRK